MHWFWSSVTVRYSIAALQWMCCCVGSARMAVSSPVRTLRVVHCSSHFLADSMLLPVHCESSVVWFSHVRYGLILNLFLFFRFLLVISFHVSSSSSTLVSVFLFWNWSACLASPKFILYYVYTCICHSFSHVILEWLWYGT